MSKRKKDWGDTIIEQTEKFVDRMRKFGEKMAESKNGNYVTQTTYNETATSSIFQGGHKIVVKTKNKKTVITVDGKEYTPKGQ